MTKISLKSYKINETEEVYKVYYKYYLFHVFSFMYLYMKTESDPTYIRVFFVFVHFRVSVPNFRNQIQITVSYRGVIYQIVSSNMYA